MEMLRFLVSLLLVLFGLGILGFLSPKACHTAHDLGLS